MYIELSEEFFEYIWLLPICIGVILFCCLCAICILGKWFGIALCSAVALGTVGLCGVPALVLIGMVSVVVLLIYLCGKDGYSPYLVRRHHGQQKEEEDYGIIDFTEDKK